MTNEKYSLSNRFEGLDKYSGETPEEKMLKRITEEKLDLEFSPELYTRSDTKQGLMVLMQIMGQEYKTTVYFKN